MNVSFAAVADQKILELTEIFPNTSYDTFLSKYSLNSSDTVDLLFDEDVLRILSYLRSISNNDSQFFSLIDAIHSKYTVKTWVTNKAKVKTLIDDAFPSGVTSHSSSSDLEISANRTSPNIDQWVSIHVEHDTNYRG
ncbi:MAG: hypothetical protein LBH96_05375 [Candidatus Peribacteria bacterium]|nr:hypothetical protein [Candidatus Peribacteria bacterium]